MSEIKRVYVYANMHAADGVRDNLLLVDGVRVINGAWDLSTTDKPNVLFSPYTDTKFVRIGSMRWQFGDNYNTVLARFAENGSDPVEPSEDTHW